MSYMVEYFETVSLHDTFASKVLEVVKLKKGRYQEWKQLQYHFGSQLILAYLKRVWLEDWDLMGQNAGYNVYDLTSHITRR